MKLFYYNKVVNFGDAINPWFWPQYIQLPFQPESDRLFVGIGTLLNNRLPETYREVHIMGSGAGYGDSVPLRRDNWHVHCVRGPLTARALGVEERLAIADPAILLNELVPIGSRRDVRCAFMPHIGSDSPRLRTIVEGSGLLYISPRGDPQSVIEQANRCERLICSAMHGAILAEALRVPWYPVSTAPNILDFKWQDWFSSMEIDTQLHRLPTIWAGRESGLRGRLAGAVKKLSLERQLARIEKKGRFVLARDPLLEQRKEQLKETFARFNLHAGVA